MASKSVAKLALPALALALGLCACSGSKPAPEASGSAGADSSVAALDPSETIEAREDNFKAIAKSMKATKAALDASTPDFAAIEENAISMKQHAQKIPALFPAGTGPDSGNKTEALAAIWERPTDFQAAITKLVDSTTALKSAASAKDAAATKAAFGNVGMSCKGCHDDFRMEKKH